MNYILEILYNQIGVSDELPVSKKGMELNDGLFLLQTELSSFDIRSEVVCPSQSTALPTSLKP